jgi:hypothetical protein
MWGEGARNAIAREGFDAPRGTTMADKQPMQGVPKGDDGAKVDAREKGGVNGAPAKGQGGESGGGSYPNPHDEK